MSADAPLFGLVLAGGASTRMQRDKAAIEYHGQSQLHWTFHLLSHVCAATFVSVRPDQREEPTRAGLPQIVDRQPGIGPIAGISAALHAHPKAAWLVVACDLPFLNEQTLRHLVEHRDSRKIATAFKSSHDGLPEPLCAIWEPAAREPVLAFVAAGKQCPRKFLINADSLLLDLPDTRALDNVNTSDEYSSAVAAFSSPSQRGESQFATAAASGTKDTKPRTLRVQYYAILREQAGRSEETLDTTASTPAELFDELRQRHPFQLNPAQLKVALNSEFSDWQTPLRHGDTVVFIPPVAGG
ncbi:NTP transferase domain-containing protein [Steroidobacter cummioxidans]|uniref:NTP transferase domain-containing protein n=1 Tax=Steroidobacter cummioxidans TaxID=1803913 RepID=UPI000E31DBF2|nr:NTP transferase domain-containing protein [Steroidobacter cummioxidans]